MATINPNQDESPEKDEQDDKMHPSDEGTEVMYFTILLSLVIYLRIKLNLKKFENLIKILLVSIRPMYIIVLLYFLFHVDSWS